MWQNRQLDEFYPVMFLDALRIKEGPFQIKMRPTATRRPDTLLHFCYLILIPQASRSATPATGGHIAILAIAGSFHRDVDELELGNVSANAVGAIAADAKMVVIATPRRLTFFKIFSFHFESDVGGNRECATREKSCP